MRGKRSSRNISETNSGSETSVEQTEDQNEESALNGINAGACVDQIKEEKEEEEEVSVAKKRCDEGMSQRAKKDKPVAKEENKEVVKTLAMKGKAPVDPEYKAKIEKAHVYSEGNDVYKVLLNQTDIKSNTNKFYRIKLLHDDIDKVYSVHTLGENGPMVRCKDLAEAKDIFKNEFFEKTKNEWDKRADFEKVAGKYDMVFVNHKAEDKVQSLLKLCDLKAMEECVLEMKFDIKKAPLGKLTSEQILAGYASLKKIEECLKKKGSNEQLMEACNEFYTRIPHDFGRRKPPIIGSEEELKEKIALLEDLSDIQIAVEMVPSILSDEDPLDRQYPSLKCQLLPLDSDSDDYKVIEKYLQSTHAPSHTPYTLTIMDVFAVEREAEKDNVKSNLNNRMLLWHGSRLSNWVGILSQGLRLPPPEAPDGTFGKGIYFADMSSKSAHYCFANQKNNQGLLLLSEVALGDSNELLDANNNADQLPSGKHSTKGLGQKAPNPNNHVTLDGATVPMGPCEISGVGQKEGNLLMYNEYIVYNPAQTRMKYLLRVQFNFSSDCCSRHPPALRIKPATFWSGVRLNNLWQWKGDDGEWEPYAPDICAQLDTAKQAGEKSSSLALGSGYEVDLVKMVQINSVTKFKRKIRLQEVKSEDQNEESVLNGINAGACVDQIKEEKEEEEEVPVAKKRCNEGRSQRAKKAKPVAKEENKGDAQ
ncbi:Poly [ADP-ribose] polymerase 2 [Triplophysa tibetana]|uniref:Poly [ADP-ribose] polymerase n=1 Tax=Triplophysa tibetana TaxID=1572043 RepID=A0A5A9PFN5_9TELE|nr:Poly [ADP-ribose] polymerase 2 [Triplophysa tibetana]